MANTIGQLVGIIKHTYTVKNDAGETVTVTSHFDCTHASDNDIRNWIASNRTIGVQRPARLLTASEITKSLDGATLDEEPADQLASARVDGGRSSDELRFLKSELQQLRQRLG